MIQVRDIFRLKYGQARPAIALWQEGRAMLTASGMPGTARVLTDLVGPAYTLVLEMTFADLGEWERAGKAIMQNPEWKAWYQKFVPLCESGSREIYNIVE